METLFFTVNERTRNVDIVYKRQKLTVRKSYPFSSEYLSGLYPAYEKIFDKTLGEFVKQQKVQGAKAVYIMSDDYVFFDYAETPVLFGKRQFDMLKLDLAARFNQFDLYKTGYIPVFKKDGRAAYVVQMVRASHVAALQNALKSYKFASRVITFDSAMVANAFLNAEPKSKNRERLYAYVKEDKTKIVVLKDRRLLFFTDIPYGKKAISGHKAPENSLSVLNDNEKIAYNRKPDERGNGVYLARTLSEMQAILSQKYHMENLSVKYGMEKGGDDANSAASNEAESAFAGVTRLIPDFSAVAGFPDVFKAFMNKFEKGFAL